MHNIIFKDYISQDRLKKDVVLTQDVSNNGVTTRFQKHFTYFVNEHKCLRNLAELQNWIKRHAQQTHHVHTFVNKNHNRHSKKSSFEIKKTGKLYIVRNRDVFIINFVQSFKIDKF